MLRQTQRNLRIRSPFKKIRNSIITCFQNVNSIVEELQSEWQELKILEIKFFFKYFVQVKKMKSSKTVQPANDRSEQYANIHTISTENGVTFQYLKKFQSGTSQKQLIHNIMKVK